MMINLHSIERSMEELLCAVATICLSECTSLEAVGDGFYSVVLHGDVWLYGTRERVTAFLRGFVAGIEDVSERCQQDLDCVNRPSQWRIKLGQLQDALLTEDDADG